MKRIEAYLARHGWEAFPFQRQAWKLAAAGGSGLIHAPTGMGKTLAALGGALNCDPTGLAVSGLTVLWLTPLKALAHDTAQALGEAAAPWRVEVRSGDTSPSLKKRQRAELPQILVTTPESLHLLMTHPEFASQCQGLRLVVVDEWHEFMSTKRGVQVELALARLRRWAPTLATWGLTATIGNLAQALAVLVPNGVGHLIQAPPRAALQVDVAIPEIHVRFPWAGHLGAAQLPRVIAALENAQSTLVFTNTRAQAERWFQLLIEARPEWLGAIALHHGSLDRSVRQEVEALLGAGALRAVVCTSALDLGIDLAPVDQVLQIGCPLSVARLLQRAGRSNHRPGGVPRICCIPTHALEILELEALRELIAEGVIEPRVPLRRCLDVLCQWLITVALGDGLLDAASALAEVRTTHAYAQLSGEDFDWCLAFVAHGGELLRRYPQYLRLQPDPRGGWVVTTKAVAAQHRLGIGTIAGGDAVLVRLRHGAVLGSVEESFLAGVPPGQSFTFAGRRLELLRINKGVAEVTPSSTKATAPAATWNGTRLPWSPALGQRCRELLGRDTIPYLNPLLERQRQQSALPTPHTTLIEIFTLRGEYRAVLHPFAGRTVHDGLGALLAWRLTRLMPVTVAHAGTELAVGLHASQPLPTDELQWRQLLDPHNAAADLRLATSSSKVARVRFRQIARVAGLIVSGPPGDDRRRRQQRVSADLLHDVFAQHDPGNRLLFQAQDEAWNLDLAGDQVVAVLTELAAGQLTMRVLTRLSPLAFPVWAEFIRGRTTSEQWTERVARMALRLERA